jgi:hypothetical protein
MQLERARRRRQSAAERWRPAHIELLLVAEAPPSALDRYFYFEDVRAHDSLFRYVVEAVLGDKPSRDKAPYLDALRDRGVFLVDACVDPFADHREALPRCLPGLAGRIRSLRPASVVLIGARVYDLAYDVLLDAGLPVVDLRLPYPGSGQQRRFLEGFKELTSNPASTTTSGASPCPLGTQSSPVSSPQPSRAE